MTALLAKTPLASETEKRTVASEKECILFIKVFELRIDN